MCPQCILKIQEDKMKTFPNTVTKDSFHLENSSPAEHNACSSSHNLHPVWITEGVTTGNSFTDLKKSFQGKS
jgi:hypothetical protein